MNQKMTSFLAAAPLLRCPLCHSALTALGSSLVCAGRHTFDLSKKGAVNFVPGQKALKYTGELFQARGRILAGGFYEPLADQLRRILETMPLSDGGLTLLDAGCGQGYYSKLLADDGHRVLGFDLSPEAIALASAGEHRANFFVGDLTNIPVIDHSVDVVLDILTQANYTEFHRVLKPHGRLIKVIPGVDYLREIRALLGDQLDAAKPAAPVADHFERHFPLLGSRSLHYTLPLDPSQAKDFVTMTPMTFHIDTARLSLAQLNSITIDLRILVGGSK